MDIIDYILWKDRYLFGDDSMSLVTADYNESTIQRKLEEMFNGRRLIIEGCGDLYKAESRIKDLVEKAPIFTYHYILSNMESDILRIEEGLDNIIILSDSIVTDDEQMIVYHMVNYYFPGWEAEITVNIEKEEKKEKEDKEGIS